MSVILRRGLLLLLGLLLLSGCQTLQERARGKELEKTLHNYELTLRWGYLQHMDDFLAPDVKPGPPITEKALNNIRVTSYEVVRSPVYVDSENVTQTVAIHYVFEDQQVEKQLTDQQLWTYDPEMERWNRANPNPNLQ